MSKQIKIRVIPRASKNEIVGTLADNILKIKLKAPPVDGKANKALVEFLSEEFGVSKNRIRIVRGERSKNKVVEIG